MERIEAIEVFVDNEQIVNKVIRTVDENYRKRYDVNFVVRL
jgi:hypothetical protein